MYQKIDKLIYKFSKDENCVNNIIVDKAREEEEEEEEDEDEEEEDEDKDKEDKHAENKNKDDDDDKYKNAENKNKDDDDDKYKNRSVNENTFKIEEKCLENESNINAIMESINKNNGNEELEKILTISKYSPSEYHIKDVMKILQDNTENVDKTNSGHSNTNKYYEIFTNSLI